jgi:hypothetical protein
VSGLESQKRIGERGQENKWANQEEKTLARCKTIDNPLEDVFRGCTAYHHLVTISY